jgi:ABC-type antimicrobial peptide transport system permease subunit
MALLVRAPGAEAETLTQVAEVVRALDPTVAVQDALPLEQIAVTSLFPARFAAQVVGTFGLVGLILGALGIYGVLSYQVSRRIREMGVRRALGATSARLMLSVVARGGAISAVGCVVGMALGGVLAHVARGMLYGIRPLDPVAFSAVPAVLLLVASVASVIPARRASTVSPSEALRAE